MITADQLVVHAIGDYLLQSHWKAVNKVRATVPAALHAGLYTSVFVLLTSDWHALVVIAGSHFVIDRWRLARYLVWAKNHLAPRSAWVAWAQSSATGYSNDVPPWLAVWLMIVADNICHVVINGLALQ